MSPTGLQKERMRLNLWPDLTVVHFPSVWELLPSQNLCTAWNHPSRMHESGSVEIVGHHLWPWISPAHPWCFLGSLLIHYSNFTPAPCNQLRHSTNAVVTIVWSDLVRWATCLVTGVTSLRHWKSSLSQLTLRSVEVGFFFWAVYLPFLPQLLLPAPSELRRTNSSCLLPVASLPIPVTRSLYFRNAV